MKKLEIVLMLLVLMPLVGCNISINGLTLGNSGIEGSGVEVTEEREIDEFDSITLVGFGAVDLTVGPETFLAVTTDDNLLEVIETTVENGNLKIRPTESIDVKSGLKFKITTPTLAKVKVEGATSLTVNDAAGESLSIDVSGAGKVDGNGDVTNLDLEISGAGSIKLADLKSENTTVEISGAGSASVYASESIDANLSGVGSVKVYGSPATVKKNVSGLGTVKLVD